jgi:hypothetical protein
MSEDTSSNPRREWYEADYEPDEPGIPFLQLYGGSLNTPARRPDFAIVQGPHLKPGDPFRNKDGDLIGIVQSYDIATGQVSLITSGYVTRARRSGASFGVHIHAVAEQIIKGIQASMAALVEANKKSDYVLFPPPLENETVRERALRLAKQPHSMAQDPRDFHFDHRGRRRY